VVEPSVIEGPKQLSRFSDKPEDASLEDLFPPIDKRGDNGAEPSTSTTVQELQYNGVHNEFAKGLNARVEKQKENDSESMNGGKLIEFAMQLENIDASVLYNTTAALSMYLWYLK